MSRLALLIAGAVALFARTAAAQPPVAPAGAPEPKAPPLAQIKDAKQLSEVLSAITQDPSIQVDDPALRPLAQALMVEGVKQLQAKAYDQALANFLDAYAKFPSPKILLNVASTLRDMGRLADAANTYQRYLLDPATAATRVGEVKELLLQLDQQLTILTVRVFPRGSDISIDGGPFIPVGSSLLTRVRPGIHLVRIRKDDQIGEITINGFEGENKEVSAALKVEVVPAPPPVTPPVLGKDITPPPEPPEQAEAWLQTGTQYGSKTTGGRERTVRAGFAGPEVTPIVPNYDIDENNDAILYDDATEQIGLTSGMIVVVRIDGEGRGFAGGAGFAVARGRFEGDVMVLRSNITGAYIGGRYRILTGWLRPYVGLGIPGFVYDQMTESGDTTTKLAIGVRGAAGVELVINGHLSVQADLGYEHFFGVEDTQFDPDVFVPTIGLIGRL